MMVRRIVAEDDAANSGRRLIQATEELIEHLERSELVSAPGRERAVARQLNEGLLQPAKLPVDRFAL
jgi:hypothetical protein